MKVSFYESPELDEIGNRLVAELLPNISIKIKFLLISGQVKFAGKVLKASPLLKFMTGYDLVVLVNRDVWESLPNNYKEALVFHELYHIQIKNDKVSLKKHDVEEFVKVVERYGPWTDALKAIQNALARKK